MNEDHPLKELRQYYQFKRNDNDNESKLLRIIRIKEMLNTDIKIYMTHRYKGDWGPEKIKIKREELEKELKQLLKDVAY